MKSAVDGHACAVGYDKMYVAERVDSVIDRFVGININKSFLTARTPVTVNNGCNGSIVKMDIIGYCLFNKLAAFVIQISDRIRNPYRHSTGRDLIVGRIIRRAVCGSHRDRSAARRLNRYQTILSDGHNILVTCRPYDLLVRSILRVDCRRKLNGSAVCKQIEVCFVERNCGDVNNRYIYRAGYDHVIGHIFRLVRNSCRNDCGTVPMRRYQTVLIDRRDRFVTGRPNDETRIVKRSVGRCKRSDTELFGTLSDNKV